MSAVFLAIAGVWVILQVTKGGLLQRLGIS